MSRATWRKARCARHHSVHGTVHPASETCILQATTAFKSPSLALPPPVSPPTLVIDVQISHRHPHFRTLLEALMKPVLMKPVLMDHPHGYVYSRAPMLQLPLMLLCTNPTKCTNQRIHQWADQACTTANSMRNQYCTIRDPADPNTRIIRVLSAHRPIRGQYVGGLGCLPVFGSGGPREGALGAEVPVASRCAARRAQEGRGGRFGGKPPRNRLVTA